MPNKPFCQGHSRAVHAPKSMRVAAVLATFILLASLQGGTALADGRPSFMSLKIDTVELRASPDPAVTPQWIFKRAGMPVAVQMQENGWARISDHEGASGWVRSSHLSRRRTAIVARGENDQVEVALRSDRSAQAGIVALLEPGVLLNLFECDGTWCLAGLNDVRGYVPQVRLWGVANGETFQ